MRFPLLLAALLASPLAACTDDASEPASPDIISQHDAEPAECPVSEVWIGDVTDADLADAAKRTTLERVRVVLGNVTITSASATLPALERIDGALTINAIGKPGAPLLGAPKLARVDGDLVFRRDASGHASLPALKTVGGRVSLEGALATLDLPLLETIGGGFRVEDRTLATLDLPRLVRVGGSILLNWIPTVSALKAPTLTWLGEGLYVIGIDELTTLELPLLHHAESINLDSLPALTTLALPELTTLDSGIWLSNLPALTRADVPRLEAFTFLGLVNTGLTSFDTRGPIRTEIKVHISLNPALTSVRLRHPDELHELHVSYNRALTSLALPRLQRARSIHLEQVALTDLSGIATLTSLDDLTLRDADALASLDGASGVRALRTLAIDGCDGLVTLRGLDNLAVVIKELAIASNATLPAEQVAALEARLGL